MQYGCHYANFGIFNWIRWIFFLRVQSTINKITKIFVTVTTNILPFYLQDYKQLILLFLSLGICTLFYRKFSIRCCRGIKKILVLWQTLVMIDDCKFLAKLILCVHVKLCFWKLKCFCIWFCPCTLIQCRSLKSTLKGGNDLIVINQSILRLMMTWRR